MTTKDQEGHRKHGDLHLNFYPAAMYAYTIGANTIEMKKSAVVPGT